MFTTDVRVIGKEAVEAKLALGGPRILEQNRAMVEAMLAYIRPQVVADTPYGPGHFGYHLRDRFTTDTRFVGMKTIGALKSPPTGYFREFGTLSHFIKHHGKRFVAVFSSGGHGERAFHTAHKALAGSRRVINGYYGGLANWWRG